MRILNQTLLSGGSMATSINSGPLLLAYAFGYSIQFEYTGSPVGTVTLQGSNDPVPNAKFPQSDFNPTNWTTIQGTTITVPTTDGLTGKLNDSGVYYNWVRLVYTATSGTGSLTVVGNTKGT